MTSPRSVVLALYAALNERDLERYASLLDADVVATFNGSTIVGRSGVTDYVAATLDELPSFHASVEVLVASSDLAVICVHAGRGDDASAPLEIAGRSHQILRVQGERIVELIGVYTAHPDDRHDIVALPLRTEAAQVIGEQAALRHVAELAARAAGPDEIFEAVVMEAAKLVGVAFTTLLRFEPNGATEVVAIHDPPEGVTVGMRAPADGDGATQRVWRTGRAARVDDLSATAGRWPHLASSRGYSSSVAAPIVAEDRLWGVLVAAGREALSARIEEHLGSFAELTGTAISEARARADLQALADQQAALRRVAELVSRGAEPQAVLDAVVDEASRRFGDTIAALMRYGADGFATVVAARGGRDLLGVRIPLDGESSTADVARTGRPSRTDDYRRSDARDAAAAHDVAATASVPVIVDDTVWGSLTVGSPEGPLPDGIEDRIADFAGLVETAISSAHARERLHRLADEQSALRRVAELVARAVGPGELFASVAVEASRLIDGFGATLIRLDEPGRWTVVATHGGPAPTGTRLTIREDDQGLLSRVGRTGRPGRLDDYGALRGPSSGRDQLGLRSSVAVPIFVNTRLWGVLGASSPAEPLPPESEQRLGEFAELITAALANAEARAEVQALADEQAALLRVAERVAGAEPADEIFSVVAAEAQQLLGGQAMTLTSFDESDAALVVISSSGGPAPAGTHIEYEPDTLPDLVRRTARPVRVDDYTVERDAALARRFDLSAAVAAPIAVEGRVWGMLTATSAEGPLPAGTEARLQRFANLVATAVANATSRAQLVASRARVLSTADETRRKLQRDLHDGAQQRLVQTVISLQLARRSLTDGDVPSGIEQVGEGLQHAERAIAALRELVSGILPASLTRTGLRGGVESLLFDLPLPVDADIDPSRHAPEIENTAYFVVAEALTNIVKHANAQRASIRVRVEDGEMWITVRDDGVGGARAGEGSGLTGLFDRVDARGGTLRVTSSEGQGTTIEVVIPLDDPSA